MISIKRKSNGICRAQGCRAKTKLIYEIESGWARLCYIHRYPGVSLKPHPGMPIWKYLPFAISKENKND